MPRKSRRKGARGEREVAKLLRETGTDETAHRGSFSDSGCDIKATIPYHFEVKRTEVPALYSAFKQACRDADILKVPVVVHRKNEGEWMAFLRFEDLLTLMRDAK